VEDYIPPLIISQSFCSLCTLKDQPLGCRFRLGAASEAQLDQTEVQYTLQP